MTKHYSCRIIFEILGLLQLNWYNFSQLFRPLLFALVYHIILKNLNFLDLERWKKQPPLRIATVLSDLNHTEPRSHKDVLLNRKWKKAMVEEYEALLQNNTLSLVSPPLDRTVIGCEWIFFL